jgi:lipid A 3-O-deacylase
VRLVPGIDGSVRPDHVASVGENLPRPFLDGREGDNSKFLMRHPFKAACVVLVAAVTASAAGELFTRPAPSSAGSVESGILWGVGTATPFSYRMFQTQVSWKSASGLNFEFNGGSRLVVRHRLTLLGSVVQGGPESHYVALAASPAVEWRNRAETWTLFTGAGGGAGLIDSQGVKGGQGQDFTLNWFARGGIERAFARNLRLNATIMFQHLSNGGQTTPNPGIDAVGFMFGCTWSL